MKKVAPGYFVRKDASPHIDTSPRFRYNFNNYHSPTRLRHPSVKAPLPKGDEKQSGGKKKNFNYSARNLQKEQERYHGHTGPTRGKKGAKRGK